VGVHITSIKLRLVIFRKQGACLEKEFDEGTSLVEAVRAMQDVHSGGRSSMMQSNLKARAGN